MALISHIDPINRRIHLSIDTMNNAFHPVDIYREVRALRRTDETLRAYDNFIKGDGNIDKGGGKATERYFTLLGGTRIVPYDASHVIDVTGTLITDDGLEGVFAFDRSSLTPGVQVDIQYAPKQVEVINLNFDDLVFSSFLGGVWVDAASPYGDIGSDTFPNGNRERPVNSIQLAVQVAEERGFDTINLLGNHTLDTGDIVDGYTLVGQNPTKTFLTINDGASTVGTEIKLCTITGVLDGGTVIRECLVYTINYVNGFMVDCVLGAGTITLGGGANALFMRCVSGVPGLNTPTIDMGGAGQSLGMRDYNGGIKIVNKTGDDPFSLDIASGQVILDETVTNGLLVCRGVGKLKDFSRGTAVVISEMLNGSELSSAQKLMELYRPSHAGLGKVWYWDPYSGNDTNEGDHISRAVKTFAQAHTLARSGKGDVIIALTTNPNGHTITTENIVITKDDIMIRGQGESFEIKSADDNLDGVHITGHGVELSGMTVSTSLTNTKHCIHIEGPNTLIQDIVLTDAADGIDIAAGEYTVVRNVKAHHNSGYGIRVAGTAQHIDIMDCHIGGNGGDGIVLDGTDPHEVVIGGDTVIHKNAGWGINIGANMTNVTIGQDVSVFKNILGDINDLGTDTEFRMSNVDGTAIAQKVLEAPITDTGISGSLEDILHRTTHIDSTVYIDTELLVNGDGSQVAPFNNFDDAKNYAESKNIYTLQVHGEITLTSITKNFTFIGVGIPVINTNGQDLKNSRFYQCEMRGIYTSPITVQESLLATGFTLDGFFENCALNGDLVTNPNAEVLIANCFSGIPGTARPTLSMNDLQPSYVSVRNYSGGLTVKECDHIDDTITVEVAQGSVTFDSTCIAGTMVVRGNCKFVDETAGATVANEALDVRRLATKGDVYGSKFM